MLATLLPLLLQESEYGDPDIVEENDSRDGPLDALKKVLNNIYHGGNEITLEEYEENLRKDAPLPDVDVVHERSSHKKKKKSVFSIFKTNSKKGEKSSNGKTKKKSFFGKRFKKLKGEEDIYSA